MPLLRQSLLQLAGLLITSAQVVNNMQNMQNLQNMQNSQNVQQNSITCREPRLQDLTQPNCYLFWEYDDNFRDCRLLAMGACAVRNFFSTRRRCEQSCNQQRQGYLRTTSINPLLNGICKAQAVVYDGQWSSGMCQDVWQYDWKEQRCEPIRLWGNVHYQPCVIGYLHRTQETCRQVCGVRLEDAVQGTFGQQGACPIVAPQRYGACQSNCQNDVQCNNGQAAGQFKCCNNGCAFVCTATVGTQKTGTCRPPNNYPEINFNGCANFQQCLEDANCPGTDKCCLTDQCGRRCIAPVLPTLNPTVPAVPQVNRRICSSPMSQCFANPCQFATCPQYPTAVCEANYCGGCNADWSVNGNAVKCNSQAFCPKATAIPCQPMNAVPGQIPVNRCTIHTDCHGNRLCCQDACRSTQCVDPQQMVSAQGMPARM